MRAFIVLLFTLFLFTSTSKSAVIEGVTVEVIPKDGGKLFRASVTKRFNISIEQATKRLIQFEEKCNNDLRIKRKIIPHEKKCLIPNGNVIEAVKIDATKGACQNCFLIYRRIYNRSYFQHYDLITKAKNSDGSITIGHRMLKEAELKKFIKENKKSRSVFQNIQGEFIVKPINQNEVEITYRYSSFTTNWFLNLDLSQNTILENMANGTLTAINGAAIP